MGTGNGCCTQVSVCSLNIHLCFRNGAIPTWRLYIWCVTTQFNPWWWHTTDIKSTQRSHCVKNCTWNSIYDFKKCKSFYTDPPLGLVSGTIAWVKKRVSSWTKCVSPPMEPAEALCFDLCGHIAVHKQYNREHIAPFLQGGKRRHTFEYCTQLVTLVELCLILS